MISLSLFLAVLAPSGGATAQAAPPGPFDVLAMLHEGSIEESIQDARARRARYVSIMAALAARPAPPESDPSAEAEVVRVARDGAAHPERVRELIAMYVVKVDNPKARFVVSPPPQSLHLAPQYRYAWEYLFLLPSDQESAGGYGQSALEALAKIREDASLPLIVDSFKRFATVYRRDYSIASQIQAQMFIRVKDFVSERGLDAVIECAEDMRKSQEACVDMPPSARTRIDRLVEDMFQPRFPSERSAAWAEVIAAVRRKPEKRARLATIDRYFGSNTRP